MIISCIGDSLTEGDYGIKGVTGVANVHSENYPYYLSRMLNCEVRNYGKCGFKSSAMLQLYKTGSVDVKGSDIVLIMLGTNGGQSAEGDSDENRAYRELVDCVRNDAPGAKVILITPPNATMNPIYSNSGYMPQVAEAQGFVRKTAAETGLQLIDLSRAFRPELEYIFQPNDGLHFTKPGYMRLAHIIYNYLAPLRTAPQTIKTDCRVKLVAHRGLSGLECENTAASFTAAGNRSCYYGIETDIWLTKDDVLVCSHDKSTARLCKTAVSIPETDFEDLRRLTLTDIDRETPCGQYIIPTLEEYVRICRKYSKHAVPELKADFTLEQIQRIIAVFEKYDYLKHTTFIAFNIANLDLVRRVKPGQSCQWLMGMDHALEGWYNEIAPMLAKRGMDLDCDYSCISKEAVTCLHESGIRINVWTVDNPDCAVYLEECGVDYITTNILEN